MASTSSQAPATIGVEHFEFDSHWRAAFRQIIESRLEYMVVDARKKRDDQLAASNLSAKEREGIETTCKEEEQSASAVAGVLFREGILLARQRRMAAAQAASPGPPPPILDP